MDNSTSKSYMGTTRTARRKIHPKDCYARIFIKKEDLPEATRDILYPEEKRELEIKRRLKETHKAAK